MGRRQVIVVDAVLDHQLPVGGDVVFLHAGDDLHLPGRRLVDHQVDIVLGAGEIVDERIGVLVEAHEPEAAILLEPRRPPQPERDLVERLGIGVAARHAAPAGRHCRRSSRDRCTEAAPVALALGADDGAAVAAGVEQAVDLALLVAAEDHRPAGDLARAEIAGLLQLGGMADIDPAAAEDAAPSPGAGSPRTPGPRGRAGRSSSRDRRRCRSGRTFVGSRCCLQAGGSAYMVARNGVNSVAARRPRLDPTCTFPAPG